MAGAAKSHLRPAAESAGDGAGDACGRRASQALERLAGDIDATATVSFGDMIDRVGRASLG